MGKMFKSVEFTFLENVLIRDIFTHAPHAPQNLPPSSCHHALYAERNYPFPQASFFRKSVSPNRRKGRRKLFASSKFSYKI